MTSRILIITNEHAQDLPINVIDRFQLVILVVGQGQNNLPINIVTQLLTIQSQHNVKIELMAVKNTSKPIFDLHFSMQLGRLLERNPEGHFTLLTSDSTFDPLLATCKEQGVRINRVEALQRLSAVPTAQPEIEEPRDIPVITAAAPVAAPAADTPLDFEPSNLETPENESASSRNHRLISSLLSGTR